MPNTKLKPGYKTNEIKVKVSFIIESISYTITYTDAMYR